MTVNKALLQQAIDTMPDQLRAHSLVVIDDGTPCYCAAGWMGHVAGFTDEDLIDLRDYIAIPEAYGITPGALRTITTVNDYAPPSDRRAVVCRALRALLEAA